MADAQTCILVSKRSSLENKTNVQNRQIKDHATQSVVHRHGLVCRLSSACAQQEQGSGINARNIIICQKNFISLVFR